MSPLLKPLLVLRPGYPNISRSTRLKVSVVPGQELPRSPRVKFRGERKRDEAKDGEDGSCPDLDGQTEESTESWRGSPSATREREIISGDKLAEA